MDTSDRVVLVAAGFGIWQAGRHVASARWTDVVHARALSCDQHAHELVCVALGLRDGTEVLVHGEIPGFEQFLAAAEAALPGMRPRATWLGVHPGLAQPETVLFDRHGPRV